MLGLSVNGEHRWVVVQFENWQKRMILTFAFHSPYNANKGKPKGPLGHHGNCDMLTVLRGGIRKMAVRTAKEIADALIHLSREHRSEITNLKLQKLLYYAQAW